MRSDRLATYLALAAISAVSSAAGAQAPVDQPKIGDVSMHGYFRTGFGVSSEKGRQVCFRVDGALSKYRLGNECEQYGEFLFSTPAYIADDGVIATANLMLAGFLPMSSGHNQNFFDPLVGATGVTPNFQAPQMWVDLKKIPWLAGGTAWIGRRYYKREDFHLADFFYWNPSGLGGGIEDINVGGSMKFSYAVFVNDGAPTATAPPPQDQVGVRNDFQLRGIAINPGGELQIGISAILDVSDDPTVETHSGFSGTVQHVQQALGGANKLAVQYGVGPGTGLGGAGSLADDTDVTRLRIVDHFNFQANPMIGGQIGGVYQRDENVDGDVQSWYSAGGRVSIGFTEHAQLIADIGHDTVVPEVGDTRQLTKITIAPAITANRTFWARPQLRLFWTFALWNDAARDDPIGIDTEQVFSGTDATSGSTFGIHAETWW